MTGRTPFVLRSRIRFVDTDASGRIHYTALFRHLEAAEDEFLRSLGFAYSEMESGELSFPRVHVEADYLAALGYDDPVYVTVTVAKVGRSSFTLEFNVYLEETSDVAASGLITVVCISRKTKRAHLLPPDLKQALSGRDG
jgi:YbgC/YbaW family acyl-CoA thioester hydrolase